MTRFTYILVAAVVIASQIVVSECRAQGDCLTVGPTVITQVPATGPQLWQACQNPPGSNIWYITLNPHATATQTTFQINNTAGSGAVIADIAAGRVAPIL